VLDGVPEGLACVLEGNLVVQPRASQLRKADGEIEREPVVLRRPGRCLVGAAEVLEDETSEAAVVGGAFAAQHQHPRAPQLNAISEVELGAGAVEQRPPEGLWLPQAVEEVEQRDADVLGEGEGDGLELRAKSSL